MKIIKENIFEGKNIYSKENTIKIYVDFECCSETPTKDILNFNTNLINILLELKKCKDNIDYENIYLMSLKNIYKVIIEVLENRLNLNNRFRGLKKLEQEIYCEIIEYKYKDATLEMYKLAVDLINALMNDYTINIENRFKKIESIKIKEIISPSIQLIFNKAKQKNMPVIKLNTENFYQIGYGKMGKIFDSTLGDKTKSISVKLACDKLLVNEFLKSQYIPIVNREKIKTASGILEAAKKVGYPVVLKAQYENQDKCTILNIKDEKNLLKEYRIISKKQQDIILEKHIEGKKFRVCVVDYEVVAVALRLCPFIIGNGKKNIKELIQDLNKEKERRENNKVKIDEELLNCIDKQGLCISSIPIKEERVYLRQSANILGGGTSEDFTDVICKENKEICKNIAKTLGLDVCGIDIITKDISKSLNESGAIIDISATPNIEMHEFPYKGEKRDISGSILNMVYENYIKNIPIISVIDKSGEEILVKGINYILSKMGHIVGARTNNKIIIDNNCINKKDNNKNLNAKTIFLNKEVDIGVLAVTTESVVSNGLEYELCDVAIMKKCNILDENKKSEELELAELLILDSIKDDGYAIINVDECNDLNALNRIKNKKILFSMNVENEFLKENIILGNPIVYIDNEIMYVENNNKRYMICKIKDIGIISDAKDKYNIQNAMAICAALVGLKIDYCMIAKGLKTFEK